MSDINHRYTVQELSDPKVLNYLFFSEAQKENEDVMKIIQYAYVQHFNNKPVHNLGFGNFKIETGEINDGAITNNGDAYKILNTVLSSIPLFYANYPQDIILVQGSDGREDFEANCRPGCVRGCGETCHNFNRRMRIYCNYVSRKFDIFEADYQFLGGLRNDQKWFDFETFVPGRLYDAIMLFQKNA